MAVPTTRLEFKEYVLRSLGSPVIEINVSDEQVEDRIDQALRYFYDYHFDGTHKTFFKVEITEEIRDTKQITLPENIIGAIRIFDIGMTHSTKNMFNIRYQIALNDMHTLSNVSMINYFMSMQQLGLIEEILTGKSTIRYNRHRNILHLDMAGDHLNVGSFIVVEAYEIVDPAVYPDVWSDRWLQHYTAQLVKRQWGSNITKFEGLQLPGGVQYNGLKIYDDADAEIKRLEEEMMFSYSTPPLDMIG